MYEYKIYEIKQALLDCADPETGEIIDYDRLMAVHIEKEELAEQIAMWSKSEKALAEGLKAEKMALAERQAKAEKRSEQLKMALAELLGGEKLTTAKVQVQFRKTKSIDVQDVGKLADFAKDHGIICTKVKVEADKTAIKKLMAEGVDFGDTATVIEKTNTIIK